MAEPGSRSRPHARRGTADAGDRETCRAAGARRRKVRLGARVRRFGEVIRGSGGNKGATKGSGKGG